MRFVVAPDFDFNSVAAAVAGGRVDLLKERADVVGLYVIENDKQIAALVIGAVSDGRGRDLVLHALEGQGCGLVDAVDAFMREAARQGGFDGVRSYTERQGMMRHFREHNWNEIGRVYRVTVSHG